MESPFSGVVHVFRTLGWRSLVLVFFALWLLFFGVDVVYGAPLEEGSESLCPLNLDTVEEWSLYTSVAPEFITIQDIGCGAQVFFGDTGATASVIVPENAKLLWWNGVEVVQTPGPAVMVINVGTIWFEGVYPPQYVLEGPAQVMEDEVFPISIVPGLTEDQFAEIWIDGVSHIITGTSQLDMAFEVTGTHSITGTVYWQYTADVVGFYGDIPLHEIIVDPKVPTVEVTAPVSATVGVSYTISVHGFGLDIGVVDVTFDGAPEVVAPEACDAIAGAANSWACPMDLEYSFSITATEATTQTGKVTLWGVYNNTPVRVNKTFEVEVSAVEEPPVPVTWYFVYLPMVIKDPTIPEGVPACPTTPEAAADLFGGLAEEWSRVTGGGCGWHRDSAVQATLVVPDGYKIVVGEGIEYMGPRLWRSATYCTMWKLD